MTGIIDGYTTLGDALSADDLLRQMDAAGEAQAVLAPMDRELAVHNEKGDARLLSEAERSGGRFIPACTATPWRGDDAVTLIRRAAGARLLIFAPVVPSQAARILIEIGRNSSA